MYKTALRKFPESGVLYNDYGELLWDRNDFAAASKQWLRGIQTDQNFSGNYYNAARYYYMTEDKVWGLLYGEIFLNLESYSRLACCRCWHNSRCIVGAAHQVYSFVVR
jgi:hypothetical protein